MAPIVADITIRVPDTKVPSKAPNKSDKIDAPGIEKATIKI